MSVRDEIAAYEIDDAEDARRLGRLRAQHDWPRLPDATQTLAIANRAYEHASRRIKRQLNRGSFVAAFALAHLQTLIELDERPRGRPHFHRGRA